MSIETKNMDQSTSACSPEDISLKSYFLGLQADNATLIDEIVTHIFKQWFDWRRSMYESDGRAVMIVVSVARAVTTKIQIRYL